jgi:hypothetical protein
MKAVGRFRLLAGAVLFLGGAGTALAAPPSAPFGPVLAVADAPEPAPSTGAVRLQHVQGGGRAIGPGTRLMYYASSASIQGSQQQAQLKPNCNPAIENCWITPSGNIVANVDTASAAGEGYTQVDVLYLDERVCVLRVTSHLRELTSGAVIATGATGMVSRDGCGDYWVPADQLTTILGVRHAGLQVLPGAYPVAGGSIDAIFVSDRTSAGRFNASYEVGTGFLLVHSGRTQGGSVPVIGPGGQVQTGSGGSLLTYAQLIGVMTMPAVPAPTPLPDAVARVSGLTYACSLTTAYPGIPTTQTPCQQDFEVVERTPYWLRMRVLRQTASIMGPIPDVVEDQDVLTAGGYGGVYASVPWLRGLAPGAVLEDDAITGVRARVEHSDASAVVVVATASTQRVTYVYDPQSGWLTRLVVEQQNGPATTTVQLDLQHVR